MLKALSGISKYKSCFYKCSAGSNRVLIVKYPRKGRFHLAYFCTRAMSEPTKRRRVVFVVGTTGAGKTKLSVDLAKSLNGEIINCDSV